MRAVLKTMGVALIVFVLFVVSLFFWPVRIPAGVCGFLLSFFQPDAVEIRCDEIRFGFRSGLSVRALKIIERDKLPDGAPLVSCSSLDVHPFDRVVRIAGATYKRLPESYYAPGNTERNARVEAEFPIVPRFTVILDHPDILAVTPYQVEMQVSVLPHRVNFDDIRLAWFDGDDKGLTGKCSVDLDTQLVEGSVAGYATQAQIRPMIVVLDVPVALPYMDGFTEVKNPVRASCDWRINLVNNLFDLWLGLHPFLGRYNTVRMDKADGTIHLCSLTQGSSLNYTTTVGPIDSVSPEGKPLKGTIVISGTNGYNVVRVQASSGLPVADILKIGGFTGRYVGDDVIGDTQGTLEFRFPRAMTNNYEVLNGSGHVEVKNGQLMQIGLFAGMTKLLSDYVPGISSLVDQSQASADYRIENGIVRSDNIYIEGDVFSIKMEGSFDSIHDKLDFMVRTRFTKNDSLVKYFVHPVTWPFSKLLLEFHLTGSSTHPQWEYVSILDRVMDIIR